MRASGEELGGDDANVAGAKGEVNVQTSDPRRETQINLL